MRLRALFWRNQAPITTRTAWIRPSTRPRTTRSAAGGSTRSSRTSTPPTSPYLEPGKSVDFRIKVKVAELALSPTDGVYLMGVHVLQDTANVAIGRSRVFVPMVASEPERLLKMTSIAMLDSRPSLISKGLLTDDHLAERVSRPGPADRAARRREPGHDASRSTPR